MFYILIYSVFIFGNQYLDISVAVKVYKKINMLFSWCVFCNLNWQTNGKSLLLRKTLLRLDFGIFRCKLQFLHGFIPTTHFHSLHFVYVTNLPYYKKGFNGFKPTTDLHTLHFPCTRLVISTIPLMQKYCQNTRPETREGLCW